MTQLWPEGQSITVAVNERGTPIEFIWHEQRHLVKRIIQRWEVDVEWWRAEGRIWRNYVTLITEDSLLCVIYYDCLEEEWRLTRLYD